MKDLKFYLNPQTAEIRVVRMITPKTFVVFKIINSNTKTLKFWKGDLVKTEAEWQTKPWNPNFMEALSIIRLAHEFAAEIMEPFLDFPNAWYNPFTKSLGAMMSIFDILSLDMPLRDLYKLTFKDVACYTTLGKENR